jgi:hypothetical protein
MHSGIWKLIASFRRDAAGARRLAASLTDFRSIRDLLAFADALDADWRGRAGEISALTREPA